MKFIKIIFTHLLQLNFFSQNTKMIMEKKYKISESELKRLYLDRKLSIMQIANMLNVRYVANWNLFQKIIIEVIC